MTRRLSVFSLGLVLAIFLVVLYLRSSGVNQQPLRRRCC